MIPILFEYNETDFTTHGLGDLVDCIECKAKATAEGEYEMSFTYPANGELFSELKNGRIVLAKVNDYHEPQRFRIYGIESNINQTVTVNCQHISYDLANYPVKIFKDQLSPAQAVATMKNNIVSINSGTAESFPFTISGYQIQGFSSQRSYMRGDYVIEGGYTWQAIENIAAGNAFNQEQWTALEKFKVESPKNVREILLDGDDSVLGLYGGDVVFDNTAISIEKTAGQNRDVVIEYGVDLVDFRQDKNITEMVTGVLPYWKGSIRGSGNGTLGKNYEVYTGDRFEDGYTYYTRSPKYTPTSDVVFDAGKMYYIKSGNTYSGITTDDMEFKLDFNPDKIYFEKINNVYTPTSDSHYQWNKEYYIETSSNNYSSVTSNDLIIQSGVTYYERSGYSYVLTSDIIPKSGETYYVLENGTYREVLASDFDFDPDATYYELPSTEPEPEPDPDPGPDSGKIIYVVPKYDNNNLVEVSVYDKNANLIHRRHYTRDETTGNYTVVIDIDELSYIDSFDGQDVRQYKTGYDKNRNRIIQEQYADGKLTAVFIYNADHDVVVESYENGEIYHIDVTDPDREPEPNPDPGKAIYVAVKYDNDNNLVSVLVYDNNNNLIYRRIYTMDENTGRYIDADYDFSSLNTISTFDEHGVIKYKNQYDENNNLIVRSEYSNGVLQVVYIYNDDHAVITETYNNDEISAVNVTDPDIILDPDPDPEPTPDPDPKPTPDPDKLIYVVRERDDDNKLHTISVYVGDNNLVYQRRYDADNVYIDIDELEYVEETESSTIKRRKGYDASQRYIVNETYNNDVFSGLIVYGNNNEELVYESYKNEIRTVSIRDYDYYDSADSVASTSVALTYDNENNLVNASVYDKNANLTYRRIYMRDANTDKYTDAVDDVNKLNHEEKYVSGKLYTINYKDAFGCRVVRVDYRKGRRLDTVILNKDNKNIVSEVYSTNTGELTRVGIDVEYADEIINPNSDREPKLDPERDVSVVLKYNINKNLSLVAVYDKNANLIYQRRYVRNTNNSNIDLIIDADMLTYTELDSQGVKTGSDASNHIVVKEQYKNDNLYSVTIFNQDYKRTANESYSTSDAGKIYSVSGYNDYADDIIYIPTINVEEDTVQASSIRSYNKLNYNTVQAAGSLLSNDKTIIEEDDDEVIPNKDGYIKTLDEHYDWNKTYYIEKQVNIMDDDGGTITYVYSPVSIYDLIFKSGLTVYTRSITGYERTNDVSYQRGKNYYLSSPNLASFIPVDFKNLDFRHGTTYWEETGFNYTVARSKLPGVVYYVSEEISDQEVVVYGNIQYADGFSSLPASAQKIEPLDLSEFFEAEKESQVPTAARLEKKARQYILANDIGIPAIDLTVQYASLQKDIRLHDAITVKFPKLGISTTAKVSSYSYDVLKEICTEIEVKNAKASSSWSTLEDASRLRKGLIAPSRIGKKSITGDRISSGTIDGSNIASGGVGTLNLAPKAVTTTKIADNSITYNQIVDGAVTASKISDGAVRGQHILDQAIGLKKLDKDLQIFYSDIVAAMHIFSDRATINRYVESAGYYGTVYLVNVDGHYYSMSGHTHKFQADVKGNVHILPEVDWTGGDHFFNMRQTAFFKKEIAAAEERGAAKADAEYERVTAYAGGDYTSITRQGSPCNERLYYYDYDQSAFRRYTTRLYFAGTQFWYRPAGNGGVYYRKK